MLTENQKKWVEALRSGKYSQTKGTLQDKNGYCCLGVACRIYGEETGNILENIQCKIHPPIEVVKWLGLMSSSGAYGENHLTNDNDFAKTFKEIADIIESEPEGLFV